MKKIVKVLCTILVIIIVLVLLLGGLGLFFKYKINKRFEDNLYTGIEYLNTDKDKGRQYFSLENIGDYKTVDFQTYLHPDFFEQCYGSILLAGYDEEEYKNQKEKLISDSEWVREKIKNLWPRDEELVVCKMDDWDIYVYSFLYDNDEKPLKWVDDFALVGFDDNSCRISYMKFNNISLDIISSKSMPDFIMKNFNFDFMK